MYTGPNISRDGLVLYLDARNIRSFKGEPTTNLIPSPFPYGVYAYASSPVDVSTTTETGSIETVKRYTITSAINVARGMFAINGTTTGVAYTLSIKWRYNGLTTPNPVFIITADKGNPETANNTFSSSLSEVTSIGRGWYYSRYTFTFATNPTGGSYVTFGIQTLATTSFIGETFDVYQAQLEVKPYPTPFVLGTRGATVATGGGWADLSGKNNHGTLVNQPIFSNVDNGIIFNGTNNNVDITFNALGAEAPWTMSAWFKAGSQAFTGGVISLGYSPIIVLQTSGELRVWWYNGTTWPGIVSSAKYNDNKPYYVTATCTGTAVYLYVNGVLIGSNLSTSVRAIYNLIRIGIEYNNGSKYFTGTIYSTKVYNRFLSENEVLQNYNATKSKYGL